MGSQRNWRYAVDADDWMRFMEKRVMHEERRPVIRNGTDLLGPGLAGPYASRTFDWNDVACLSDGFWYSVANQVRNSPDDTAHWMGVTEGNLDGDGIQTLSEYRHATDSAPIRQYNRRFWTVDSVTNFGTWKVTGGGGTGGGGSPTGPAGGDLTGTYPNPSIGDGRVGNDEIAVNAVTPDKIADLPAVPATPGDPTSKTYVDDQIAAIPPNPTNLPPSGPAGGSLAGTYPNPTIAPLAVTLAELASNSVNSSKIVNGTITDVDVATANKDGIAATPSMRTLGTGAQQALPGNTPVALSTTSVSLPALAAGTWVPVTHNLGKTAVIVSFFESGVEIVLDYRTVSTTAIDVWTDVAVAAGVYTMVVIG